jgi:quinol monooxygenase YgiN
MISHTKTDPTGRVISSYYRVHPDDRQKFIDAVVPHLETTAAQPGCIYYVFAQDIADPDAFHLSEAWADDEALERHMADPAFIKAVSDVMSTVRVLDNQGQIYNVSSQAPVGPPGGVKLAD